MNPDLDLRELAVNRKPTPPPRRTPIAARYALPAAIVVGFVAVMAWAARDSFLPAHPVTVAPVMTSRADMASEGTPLFQAAGWVEPRPTPILVPALAGGVVQKLSVVEGQQVREGDEIAVLVDADAKLAYRAALAEQELRVAEVDSAQAALAAAQANFDRPIQLQVALAEAEAMLVQKQTEQATLPRQLESASAREEIARQDVDGKQKAGGTVAAIIIDRAAAELRMATANVAELKLRQSRIDIEVAAWKRKHESLQKRLELRIDETRQLAEAKAQAQAAAVRRKQADIAIETARLRLDRMLVKAPAHGRVLALLARPGAQLMGANGELAPVVSLYDPARLQVRADVRLEDVPRIRLHMRAKVEAASVPGGSLDGEVVATTGQADIQKNTLQVKVAVDAPPDTLRPDMLVQVTFLAPKSTKPAHPDSQPMKMLISRSLVEKADGGDRVWIADQAAGVARLRSVQLGAGSGEFVEVTSGLTPADKLIVNGRDGIRDGQRIRITEVVAAPRHQN